MPDGAGQDVTLKFVSTDLDKVLADIATLEAALSRMYAKGGGPFGGGGGGTSASIGQSMEMAMSAGTPNTSSSDNTHPSQVSAQEYNMGTPLAASVASASSPGGYDPYNSVSTNWNPAPTAPTGNPWQPTQQGGVASADPNAGYAPAPGGQQNVYNGSSNPMQNQPAGGGGGLSNFQSIVGQAAFFTTRIQNRWMGADQVAQFYAGQQVAAWGMSFTQPYWQNQAAEASELLVSPERHQQFQASRWGAYGTGAGSIVGGIIGAGLGALVGMPVVGGMIGAGIGGSIGGGVGAGMGNTEIAKLTALEQERVMRQRWGMSMGNRDYNPIRPYQDNNDSNTSSTSDNSLIPIRPYHDNNDSNPTGVRTHYYNMHGNYDRLIRNNRNLEGFDNPIISAMQVGDALTGGINPSLQFGAEAQAQNVRWLGRGLESAQGYAQAAGRFAASPLGAELAAMQLSGHLPTDGQIGGRAVIPFLMGDYATGYAMAAGSGVGGPALGRMRGYADDMTTARFNMLRSQALPQIAMANAGYTEIMGGSAAAIGAEMQNDNGGFAAMRESLDDQISTLEAAAADDPASKKAIQALLRPLKSQRRQLDIQEKKQKVLDPLSMAFAEKSSVLSGASGMAELQITQEILGGSSAYGMAGTYERYGERLGSEADNLERLLNNPKGVLGRPLTPTEQAQYEVQYRSTRQQQMQVPFQETQAQLGNIESQFGRSTAVASAHMSIAQTFSGQPGDIYKAEIESIDAIIQKRKELEQIEKSGALTLDERRGIQAEIVSLVAQEGVARYQAGMTMSRNNINLSQMQSGAVSSQVGLMQSVGMSTVGMGGMFGQMATSGMEVAGQYKWQMANAATPQERAAAATGMYGALSGVSQLGSQFFAGAIGTATTERAEMAGYEKSRLSSLWSERGSVRAADREMMEAAQEKIDTLRATAEANPDMLKNPATAQTYNRMMRSAQMEKMGAEQSLQQGWTERIVSFASGMPGGFNMAGASFNYANAASHGVAARKFGGSAADIAAYKQDPLFGNSHGGSGRTSHANSFIETALMGADPLGTGSDYTSGFQAIRPGDDKRYLDELIGGVGMPTGMPALGEAPSIGLPSDRTPASTVKAGIKSSVEVVVKLVMPKGIGAEVTSGAVNSVNQAVSVKVNKTNSVM